MVDENIALRIPTEMYAAVSAIASSESETKATIIRRLLRRALLQYQQELQRTQEPAQQAQPRRTRAARTAAKTEGGAR